MTTRFIDHLLTGTHAARPAATAVPQGTLYSCSTHNLVYQSNGSTWSTWATVGGGGGSTLTTKGDLLAYDTGQVRFGVGPNDQVLTADSAQATGFKWAAGGGIGSGTAFPGSPAANDLFFRTDRNLLYFYNGTRWLTTTLYREAISISDKLVPMNITGSVLGRWTPWHTTYDLWLETFHTTTFVDTTNNGTNYWTLAFEKVDAANTATAIVSPNTSSHTVANWATTATAIEALLNPTTYKAVRIVANATGGPGTIYWAQAISYRLVG